jgi:uncharacterized lipoprotein YehR (DUF1307 family)
LTSFSLFVIIIIESKKERNSPAGRKRGTQMKFTYIYIKTNTTTKEIKVMRVNRTTKDQAEKAIQRCKGWFPDCTYEYIGCRFDKR